MDGLNAAAFVVLELYFERFPIEPLDSSFSSQLNERKAFAILTFILSNVLQGEGQPRVFAFDYSDLAKSALAHDSKEAEVIEIH